MAGLRKRLRGVQRRLAVWPPIGMVWLGSLGRLVPISRVWGFDRGLPVDRYYVEAFLAASAADIRGRVLEIADNEYTRRFGRDVARSDVLDLAAGNPRATLIGDLTSAEHVAGGTFDCIILTQTLHFIYDARAAVRTVHRLLRPGGVVLVTAPGVSKVSQYDMARWGDYWRFTTRSARRLFAEFFRDENVVVRSYGNVLAAVAFLHGLAAQELRRPELDYHDPEYEVLVAIRAVKAALEPG